MDIAAVRSPIDSGLCSNTEAKLNPGTLQQSSVQFYFMHTAPEGALYCKVQTLQ